MSSIAASGSLAGRQGVVVWLVGWRALARAAATGLRPPPALLAQGSGRPGPLVAAARPKRTWGQSGGASSTQTRSLVAPRMTLALWRLPMPPGRVAAGCEEASRSRSRRASFASAPRRSASQTAWASAAASAQTDEWSSLSQVCAGRSPAAAVPGRLAKPLPVLGSQWGDEGKGKLVDILAQRYDVVARSQARARSGRAAASPIAPDSGCAGRRECGAHHLRRGGQEVCAAPGAERDPEPGGGVRDWQRRRRAPPLALRGDRGARGGGGEGTPARHPPRRPSRGRRWRGGCC